MPQLGETVTEGTVTRWLKQVGDQVAIDEALFEVSTDKVDSEVPSPAAGYLTQILVQEGETVDVGRLLAVVGDTPEGATEDAGPSSSVPTTGDAARGGAEGSPATAGPAGGERPLVPPSATAPAPEPPAEAEVGRRVPLPAAEAPLTEPRAGAELRAGDGAASLAGAAGGDGDGPGGAADGPARVLSPVVRRLLSEHRLDPGSIAGTGAGGRITRADVLAQVDARRRAPQPAAGAPGGSQGAPYGGGGAGDGQLRSPRERPGATNGSPAGRGAPAEPPTAGARDEVIPFNNIRRRTAEHMMRSRATSAHTLAAVEVDFEGVERVRRAQKERFRQEEGFGLTYLPFVARAVVDALRLYPNVNASVGDDALVVHHDLHLGFAVDLENEGLIVPVVHNADGKRLRAIARELADLAARARSRKLTADDIAGGTFTITNPGPFGTMITAPIINQPQVAILSTDGVKRTPVVVTLPDASEGIAIHSVGVLALSFDHRVVDGAYAARFLAKLREVIETRDWSTEL